MSTQVVETKICRTCGDEKPLTEFYLNRNVPNTACKECDKAAARKRYHARSDLRDPVFIRAQGLMRRYGITSAEYDEMLQRQDGRCAVCGEGPERSSHGRLHVDHDHATGKVRALLCSPCNGLLGSIEGKPDLVEKLFAYVELHRGG